MHTHRTNPGISRMFLELQTVLSIWISDSKILSLPPPPLECSAFLGCCHICARVCPKDVTPSASARSCGVCLQVCACAPQNVNHANGDGLSCPLTPPSHLSLHFLSSLFPSFLPASQAAYVHGSYIGLRYRTHPPPCLHIPSVYFWMPISSWPCLLSILPHFLSHLSIHSLLTSSLEKKCHLFILCVTHEARSVLKWYREATEAGA